MRVLILSWRQSYRFLLYFSHVIRFLNIYVVINFLLFIEILSLLCVFLFCWGCFLLVILMPYWLYFLCEKGLINIKDIILWVCVFFLIDLFLCILLLLYFWALFNESEDFFVFDFLLILIFFVFRKWDIITEPQIIKALSNSFRCNSAIFLFRNWVFSWEIFKWLFHLFVKISWFKTSTDTWVLIIIVFGFNFVFMRILFLVFLSFIVLIDIWETLLNSFSNGIF